MLLLIKKNLNFLVKNDQMRPVGTRPLLEANAIIKGKSRGHGGSYEPNRKGKGKNMGLGMTYITNLMAHHLKRGTSSNIYNYAPKRQFSRWKSNGHQGPKIDQNINKVKKQLLDVSDVVVLVIGRICVQK